MKNDFKQLVDRNLSGLHWDEARQARVLASLEPEGGTTMKRKMTMALVLAAILMLGTMTAVAIELLTGRQFIEQIAVPMAQENDEKEFTQESYTHEELIQLIQTLNENGITLDEDSNIMRALRNGQGYWEEETLMAICREAFGGNFSTWSIEEKHWFDNMTVQIGFKEKNPYRIPGEGDMTIPEARAHAVELLKDEYGVELPPESNEQWMLWEWFYEAWTDESGFHPAKWKFQYLNRKTNVQEYSVSFDWEGNLIDISEAGFHGEQTEFDSYNMADRYFSDKYGSWSDWPLEAWAEFGEAIADLEPERRSQWCYINAGYRLPPEGAISGEQAVSIAMEDIALKGETETAIICCTSNDRPIYKVRISYLFPGSATVGAYDAVWCLELDCMTGEVLDKWEYTYGPDSPAIRMYVPFSVHESAPSFDQPVTMDEAAKLAEKERQARAYESYRQQYGENWFFWPLEAQKDALGGHHYVPVLGEYSREEAITLALNAIREQVAPEALEALGEYQIGTICCLYQEPEGRRIGWEVYVSSDPEGLSNGYKVCFDDPYMYQIQTDVEVLRTNAGNG